jgi:hypothetical protein
MIYRLSTFSLLCGDRGDWSFVPKESTKDVVVIEQKNKLKRAINI